MSEPATVTHAIADALSGGIVFPQDVLTSQGFIAFSLFVGFNTLIYLGLTLAKFAPWPPPMPPARVREILPPTIAKDTPMRDLTPDQRDLIDEPLAANRRAAAAQTLPLGFALAGVLVLSTSFASLLLSTGDGVAQYIAQLVTALIMMVIAQAGYRRRLSVTVMTWMWTGVVTLLVAELTLDAILNDATIGLAYAVVTMIGLIALAMDWRPAITGGVLSLVIVCIGGVVEYQEQGLRWALAAVTAFLIGAVLLHLRLVTIDSLTLEQLRSNALATTDPFTGLLSRHGLISIAETVAGNADRMNKQVCVMIVRISNLDSLNREYGVDYGNNVILTVSRCLQSVAREGDLVARWSGARFAVLGIGEQPDAPTYAQRVEAAIGDSGISLGKSPITILVGSAAGNPSDDTLFDLQGQAEAHMLPARLSEPR